VRKLLFSSLSIAAALSTGPIMTAAHAASPLEATRPATARSNYKTDVLIYAGDAAAYDDPEALAAIADSKGMTHQSVTSAELNQMSLDDIAKFGVIAWPGGYAGVMSDSLTQATRDNIRKAVQERGVGFVGMCAGAFIAVSPDTTWGLSLVNAKTLPYYHLEDEGTDDAMVGVSFAQGSSLGSSRQLVWWGGPYLPEWQGGVIARYSDNNQPAIAQTWAGNGLVILSGPHPEAPDSWRSKLDLSDSDGLDQEIMGAMLMAAEKQQPLDSQ
jgi:hypothetical protein